MGLRLNIPLPGPFSYSVRLGGRVPQSELSVKWSRVAKIVLTWVALLVVGFSFELGAAWFAWLVISLYVAVVVALKVRIQRGRL